VQGPGTPSLARAGSLWASNSIRTGAFTENGEVYETADEQTPDNATADVDSDKESLSESMLNNVNIALEKIPTISEPIDGPKVDDSAIAATGTTGVNDPDSGPLLRRSSTDTIALPAATMDDTSPTFQQKEDALKMEPSVARPSV